MSEKNSKNIEDIFQLSEKKRVNIDQNETSIIKWKTIELNHLAVSNFVTKNGLQ